MSDPRPVPRFTILIITRLSVRALLWQNASQHPSRGDSNNARGWQDSSFYVERFAPSTAPTLLALMVPVSMPLRPPHISFVVHIAARLNGSRWNMEPLGYACAAATFKPLAASFSSYAACGIAFSESSTTTLIAQCCTPTLPKAVRAYCSRLWLDYLKMCRNTPGTLLMFVFLL